MLLGFTVIPSSGVAVFPVAPGTSRAIKEQGGVRMEFAEAGIGAVQRGHFAPATFSLPGPEYFSVV